MRSFLPQLIAFAHVVREGSVTGAARRLGVSQSAVSQHLHRLEAKVGAPLLLREREGVRLTATGQELFELADRQADLDQLISERLDDFGGLERGHLKIIANAPMPALTLIAEFARRYPGVDLDFTMHAWTNAIDLLRKRQIDIAIVTAISPSRDWVTQTIGSARYVAYLLPDHPLAKRTSLSLTDFADHTLLIPEMGSLTQRVVMKAYDTAQLAPPRVIRTTTFPLMKEAVLAGIGIGIFLENSSADLGNMVVLPVQELRESYDIAVAVPKDKQDLALIREFRSLAESYGAG